MNNNENLKFMLSAADLQAMGFSRSMVYKMMSSKEFPVVTIGKRKYIQRDKFLAWLDSKEQTAENTQEVKVDV
ncbi:MAG: helix-turn-helix domain-containing protein [Oscillospiraceae bacterium]|nr:helix-turn-helix domain-containing protein [Oscillospiraceae bacterium]